MFGRKTIKTEVDESLDRIALDHNRPFTAGITDEEVERCAKRMSDRIYYDIYLGTIRNDIVYNNNCVFTLAIRDPDNIDILKPIENYKSVRFDKIHPYDKYYSLDELSLYAIDKNINGTNDLERVRYYLYKDHEIYLVSFDPDYKNGKQILNFFRKKDWDHIPTAITDRFYKHTGALKPVNTQPDAGNNTYYITVTEYDETTNVVTTRQKAVGHYEFLHYLKHPEKYVILKRKKE